MKITKTQLRKIIKEELTASGMAKKSTDIDLARDRARSDSPLDQIEALNLASYLEERGLTLTRGGYNKVRDFLEDMFASGDLRHPMDKQGNKMKITKTELKKIIQEELLKEFGSEEYGPQTKEYEPMPELEFEIGDEVDVLGGVLTGAVGEIVATGKVDGLPSIVLRLLRAADRRVYGGEGDEVIVQPKFLEKRTDLFAQRMGRKAENPRRGPKKYYGIKDV